MSIDVMKQALSAIEFADMYIKEIVTGSTNRIVAENLLRESGISLRAAIEQANEFNPDWDAMAVMVEEQQRMAKRIDELEAQQKPWVKTYSGGKPNYTVPEEQTCQWQGLTDEEIAEMHNEIKVRLMGTYRTEDIYRAIEAKLREKNK